MADTKFLRLFDADGKWTRDSRMIHVQEGKNTHLVDMDEYAAKHGIELPDSKHTKRTKQTKNADVEVNIQQEPAEKTQDIQEDRYGDMGQALDEGSDS